MLNSIICVVIDPRLLYYVLYWEAWEAASQEILELFLLPVVWVTGTPRYLESSLESLCSLWSDSWLLTAGKNKNKSHCWYFAATLEDQSCNIFFSLRVAGLQQHYTTVFQLDLTTSLISFGGKMGAFFFFRAPSLPVAFGKGSPNQLQPTLKILL